MTGPVRVAAAMAILAWAAIVAPPAVAQALPAAVARDVPALALQGAGTMRFLGFKVYDIRLWAPAKRMSWEAPFALELVYDMPFSGADIAARSVKEMRGQGFADEAKLKRWGADMAGLFPDVARGDMLVGVHSPGREARFYSRDKLIGAIPDPEFSRAFFDIWLSAKTSAPGVRASLFGGTPAP